MYTQYGVPSPVESVWTGSYATGLVSENPIGAPGVEWGEAYTMDSNWIHEVGAPSTTLLPLYALSEPIAAPEPSTEVLGVIGFLVIGFAGRHSWHHRWRH